VSSGPGQFLGSSVVNQVFTLRLVQWLAWVFQTKKRTEETKNPETSPEKQPDFLKILALFSGEVLFLQVVSLESTQRQKLPGGGEFFRSA